ncbi:MAG: LacI family DNA-binding transcriptional regulator [Bryobacteraceae bacterium]
MKDIALDLGVSLMTVSKALRNHSDISAVTRERVLKRMRELNYQPDWIARSMVTRRTYLVGLILPDLMHPFFAEVANGVARKLSPLGYHAVILNTEENGEMERRHVEILLTRKVDGLIIASAQRSGQVELFETLRTRKVPYVLIDRLINRVEANFVGTDGEALAAMATAHLIDQGCKTIAHIRGPQNATGTSRLRGYRRALTEHGMPVRAEHIVSGQYFENTGYEAMRQLLRTTPRPDGVFCYNDPVAGGAVKAILEAGLRVPEDIAIIGAGNVHYSDLLRVPLSTIDQCSSSVGEAAAELLCECMEAKTPAAVKHVFIPLRLVVRESSRRA